MIFLECVPYGFQACYEVSKESNLKFESGDYDIKGCYVYSAGENKGTVWYGTGGNLEARKAAVGAGKSRPKGYDCQGKLLFVFTFLSKRTVKIAQFTSKVLINIICENGFRI